MKSSNRPFGSGETAAGADNGTASRIQIGKVVGVHGLTGAVKIYSYAESPERFAAGMTLTLIDAAGAVHCHEVLWSQPHKKLLRLALRGISTREQAQVLIGWGVYIDRTDLPALEHDTHYWVDLLGMEVFTPAGRALGKVQEIIPTGANDVYVIRPTDGREADEILVPAIASVVLDIDVPNRRMVVELPEGLV